MQNSTIPGCFTIPFPAASEFFVGSLDSVHIQHIPLTQPLARPAAFPAAAREHFPDPLKSRKRAPACSIVCSFTDFGAQAPHNSPGALRAPDCLISLWFRGTSLIDGGKYTFCAPPQNRVPMHSSFVAYPQCFPIFPIYPSLPCGARLLAAPAQIGPFPHPSPFTIPANAVAAIPMPNMLPLATGPVATVLKNTRVDEKRRAVARRAKSACSAVDTRPTLPSSRRGGGCTSHSPSGMVLSQ